MNDEQNTVTAATSAALAVNQLDQSYDAEVKNFLKEKQILAIILKSCVKEFKNSSCSVQDIEEKYIESIPQVSAVAVDQDADVPAPVQAESGSRITGLSNEDTSKNEGKIVYDIRFTALSPEDGSRIRLIINLEAQRETTDLRYPIVKRGIYYAARLISAQKNVEFKNTEYQNIKKVYSIWICQNVAKAREHSILTYDLRENILFGNAGTPREAEGNYDLMSVVLLGLGSPDRFDTDDALRMLSTALSGNLTAEQKKRVLSEDFGIAMTETLERSVNQMCNLSYGIRLEGRAEGKMNMLYELVSKGLLTLSAAAQEAGQSEHEFQNGLDCWLEAYASA